MILTIDAQNVGMNGCTRVDVTVMDGNLKLY